MNFKNIAFATAIISFALGIGYLFFGSIIIGRWQIEPTNNILLLGRRIGILYIGLSIIFFLSKSLNLSKARTVLSIGAASTLSLLATIGIYEYSMGRVGAGILASVFVESLLSIGFIIILVKDRRAMAINSSSNK